MKTFPPPFPPRSLPDGLWLRQAAPADAEALAAFNARIHEDAGLAPMTRDLLAPAHPTCGPELFSLVMAGEQIVSSLCLIPQTWTYAGQPFPVGRVELVGTDPAYRRRGLVRAQMEVAHAWSAALGQSALAITGLRHYYRQFGYDYALELGGGRICPFENIPPAPADQPEPYRLRPLTLADLPLALRLSNQRAARYLVDCPWDADRWRYELTGRSPGSLARLEHQVILDAAGQPVGYVEPQTEGWGQLQPVTALEVEAGHDLRLVTPAVMRALRPIAAALTAAQGRSVDAYYFNFGREHPLYAALPEWFTTIRPPYGWYLRVPDLPELLRRLAPVLEARLAASPRAGFSGGLQVHNYRRGFQLTFSAGRLTSAADCPPPDDDSRGAAFPELTFLKLLFGYRSLADLRYAYPDAWADSESEALLEILFPRQASCLWALN